jgi:hypothetical protein
VKQIVIDKKKEKLGEIDKDRGKLTKIEGN